ncbi:MAG TPA: Re/Si-specific NAD(P)(+) transhydrogenase subunit alpha [Chthonomonadales bacterium]|nr:Re/Si-specific NAD(P)(+) transhydrogenase subunit alpha [Chthonomonadales bacterium]
MRVGVPKEMCAGERRVALAPLAVGPLRRKGIEVAIEAGAGLSAGFLDATYEQAGAEVVASRDDVFAQADVVLMVRALGADPDGWQSDAERVRPGQTLIATMDPLWAPQPVAACAAKGAVAFALELVPRITRAQAMDVLSSQASLAGYKAVLLAAGRITRIFPHMTTAAGTITPTKVLVIGAGVAGLQAISTARRLGAVVSGYDVRSAVKEQVESLGARFVVLDIDTGDAQDSGGYAKEMGEEFYRRQAELLGDVIAQMDVVITTAAIPGRKSPVLVTRAMVERMAPGSVIVDIAAERGGNCELTVAGETVEHGGVTILCPLNLPSTLATHASQLYAKNVSTFLLNLLKDGSVVIDLDDEIVRESLLTRDGEVVNARVREALGLPPLAEPAAPPATA